MSDWYLFKKEMKRIREEEGEEAYQQACCSFTGGLAGAAGGAAKGAAVGSLVFPGVGTGVGAMAGALLGGLDGAKCKTDRDLAKTVLKSGWRVISSWHSAGL